MGYYDMAVNKSGVKLAIFEGWPSVDKGRQIGTIYDREAFIWAGTEDGNEIIFRNSAGKVVQGFYYGVDANGNDDGVKDIWSAFAPVTDYPYGTVTLGGKSLKTFKFRRQENVYRGDGTSWGAVASGMEVACDTDTMGDSHPEWKSILYVKSSKTGEWVPIGHDGKDYGFVDIGLDHGSMPDTISMYGTW